MPEGASAQSSKARGSLPALFLEGGREKPKAMGIRLLRTESLVAGRLRQPGIFYGLIGLSKANLHYFHNVFDFHVTLPVKVIPANFTALVLMTPRIRGRQLIK